MKLESRKAKLLAIVFALLIVALVTISSYAYFVASVNGNDNASNNVISTGYMEITFSDGPEVTSDNLIPGNYVEKTFTVTNTGTVPTKYDIYFNNVINTFEFPKDLVYELISEDGASVEQKECPLIDMPIANNILIEVGQTHHYTLRITFKETGKNQDYNQGKSFQAKIGFEGLYDITTRNKFLRTGTYGNNSVSDLGKDSLESFVNELSIDAYIRKKVVNQVVSINNYYQYIYDGDSTFNTIEECNSEYTNDANSVEQYSCYENGNQIRYKYYSDKYVRENDCKRDYYGYNLDTNEYVAYEDEYGRGECVLITDGESLEIPIDSLIDESSTEVCWYNNGNEACFNQLLSFDDIDMDSEGWESILENRYTQLYEDIKSKKNFMCIPSYNSFQCTSEDGSALIYENNSIKALKVANDYFDYYRYTERIKTNSMEECSQLFDGYSAGICAFESDGVYYYKQASSNYSYTKLEQCQDYCNNASGECYCIGNYKMEIGIRWYECALNNNNSSCYEGRTM